MMLRNALLIPAVFAAAATAPAPKAPPVVTFHARDYAFVGPKTVTSGAVTFRLVNDGKELHHLSIMKLAKGKTMTDLAGALKQPGPPPAWTTDVGGPNPAVPGGTAEATLTLDPGEYAILCFINTPGNPMPHMAKGMIGSFTVTPDPSPAVAPAGDITLRLADYKFALSKPLTSGKHLLTVVNDAAQSHEVVMMKLNAGKTVADVASWVDKQDMKGPPPAAPVGGIAALAKGRTGSFPVDLTPGEYGIVCFVPDAKDGKPHSLHGMMTQFTVK